LNKLNQDLELLKNKKNEINKQEISLDFAPTEYPDLDQAELELQPLTDIWDITSRIQDKVTEEWRKKIPISQLNYEEMDKEMKQFNKQT
jgi:hypothetical protein